MDDWTGPNSDVQAQLHQARRLGLCHSNRAQHHCLRCGHQWRSKSECPEYCPGCKSYLYDLPPGQTTSTFGRKTVVCRWCGDTWTQQGEDRPYTCHSCNRVLDPARNPHSPERAQIARYTDA